MATAAAADVDDPSLAATLEKFRLYETRAVSTYLPPPGSSFLPIRLELLAERIRPGWLGADRRGST